MAEIRVQEKRGGMAWLWVLLLLVLAALAVWWYLGTRNSSPAAEPAPTATPAAAPTAGPSIPKHPPPTNMVFVRA